MWVKRPDAEIDEFIARQEKKRKSFVRPLITGVLISLLVMLAHYLGFRGGGRGFYAFAPHSRFDWRTVVLGIFSFVVVSALVYYKQKRGTKFFNSIDDSMLCGECQEPSHPNIENACPCGGRLEPFDYFTWEEDEDREVQTTEPSPQAG